MTIAETWFWIGVLTGSSILFLSSVSVRWYRRRGEDLYGDADVYSVMRTYHELLPRHPTSLEHHWALQEARKLHGVVEWSGDRTTTACRELLSARKK